MDTCQCFRVPETCMAKIYYGVGSWFLKCLRGFVECKVAEWGDKRDKGTGAVGWVTWNEVSNLTHANQLVVRKLSALFPCESSLSLACSCSISESWLPTSASPSALFSEPGFGHRGQLRAKQPRHGLRTHSRFQKPPSCSRETRKHLRWVEGWVFPCCWRGWNPAMPCWSVNPIGEPRCLFSKQELHVPLCSALYWVQCWCWINVNNSSHNNDDSHNVITPLPSCQGSLRDLTMVLWLMLIYPRAVFLVWQTLTHWYFPVLPSDWGKQVGGRKEVPEPRVSWVFIFRTVTLKMGKCLSCVLSASQTPLSAETL